MNPVAVAIRDDGNQRVVGEKFDLGILLQRKVIKHRSQVVQVQFDATVGEVHQRVLETREVAYTTVMTVMKKLASKGYLSYTKEGNAYVYQAARPPEEVRTDLLRGLLQKAFGGSHRALIQTLARTEPLSDEDMSFHDVSSPDSSVIARGSRLSGHRRLRRG